MDREQIISFIERIRPQIKEAGSPDDVLLKAARKENLAPAQLESTAQLLNTAQQLNFMDKSAARGDSFKLIDVPDLVSRFVQHDAPLQKEGSIYNKPESFEKAASVEAPTRERLTYGDAILTTDPTLDRPLTGKRLPDMNQMALKDAGARTEYMSLGATTPPLPQSERSVWKEHLKKEAKGKFEIESVAQIIADEHSALRKEADDIAFRLRTELSLSWGEAKSDALALSKAAAEVAVPIVEEYLGSIKGHLKVAFDTTPSGQDSVFVEDRHNIVPSLEKIAACVEQIENLLAYQEHIKESVQAPPKPEKPKSEEETKNKDKDDKDKDKDDKGPREPKAKKPGGSSPEALKSSPAPSTTNPLESVEDFIVQPGKPSTSPEQLHDDFATGTKDVLSGINQGLGHVPNPMDINSGIMGEMEKIAPKKNKAQQKIDQSQDDTKTITTIQRLMLTDPIIREADPDMVLSLYNTLQRANPEVARDSNLLRFALRESLQYESVPLHTYRDLVETEERKGKSRGAKQKLDEDTYRIQ